ncbi:glycoside hydrolase family 3 C-terminal domain-containing protein [Brotaphodocola sp.]|uniref:glycoside hydrolase family 3 C-terminal domain-containing protein n=1 Tax=Brotaphodocola sp. TaxID=3073577 RepID=UPI003D7C43AD
MKKKKNNRKYITISMSIASLLLVFSMVVTGVMQYWSTVMDAVFGNGHVIVSSKAGTENWDSDYYGLNQPGMTKEETAKAGAEVARRAEAEGIVLLKNQNHALPLTKNEEALSAKNQMTVNAMGWSFYYPSVGGSGSGAVGSNDLVKPKEALAQANIQINEGMESYYLNWSNEHYRDWMVLKENGYYTDEDKNEEPARPTVSKTYVAAWDVPELNAEEIEEASQNSQASQNEVQIVWIGRGGGEYHDLPTVMTKEDGSVNRYGINAEKHYLELTDEEKAVLDKAKELRGENGKVIVIINSNNTMELGTLQDDEKVDAILFVGGPGKSGFYAIGDVLNGTVCPSGRLADTYAVDLLKDPAMQNFGDPAYYNADAPFSCEYDTKIAYTATDGSQKERPIMFVGYEEGIYVGYRFYETAADMGYFSADQMPEGVTDPYYNRENGVVYPFGYGLSYTTFSQNIVRADYKDRQFVFEVEVENTGDTAGKDVVELYVETPYISGGIEKAKVVLCGFDKTETLKPGEKQMVTIAVDEEDLASYDDQNERCYVLDKGDYSFYLGTVEETVYGSHAWAYAEVKDSEELEVAEDVSAIVFRAENGIDKTRIYKEGQDGPRDSERYAHNADGTDYTVAENAFDREMTGNNLKVANGDKTMNRAAGFAESFPTRPTEEDCVMPQELKEILDQNNYSTKKDIATHDEDVEMPVTGAKAGISLIDLRAKDFEDPLWETYISQWTPSEMALLLGKAGFQTEAFTQYGKPTTLDNDGPQAFRHQALGEENEKIDTYYMSAFPCEALLACTWNVDLMEEIGEAVGKEGMVNDMTGWYAPGLDTHRTPFGGRNFEYFSEDGFLAGKLCAKEVAGAGKYGVFAYIKHFAMNDQEAFCRSWCCGTHMHESLDRYKNPEWLLMTWATEQTVREIYLKPFEIAIKEAVGDLNYLDQDGNRQVKKDFRMATGVMTAFNCVGNTWSGANHALLQTVLRDEWGFHGTALTDYALHDFMYPDQMIRNGGTACLQSNRKNFVDQDNPSATTVTYLQKATKEMCYMVANSNAMNQIAPGAEITYTLAPWEKGCYAGIAGASAFFLLMLASCIWRVRDKKRNPENYL